MLDENGYEVTYEVIFQLHSWEDGYVVRRYNESFDTLSEAEALSNHLRLWCKQCRAIQKHNDDISHSRFSKQPMADDSYILNEDYCHHVTYYDKLEQFLEKYDAEGIVKVEKIIRHSERIEVIQEYDYYD